MSRRDWEKLNRQKKVLDRGRDPESRANTDDPITESKRDHLRKRGRWQSVCPHCGEYMRPKELTDHVEACLSKKRRG